MTPFTIDTCRNQQKFIQQFAADNAGSQMLLLGHYVYLTVPFFSLDLFAKVLICDFEATLMSYGGPEECKDNYNRPEQCETDKTIKDTMSCRSMREVVWRSLYQCSHWPGGSPCLAMPAYTP